MTPHVHHYIFKYIWQLAANTLGGSRSSSLHFFCVPQAGVKHRTSHDTNWMLLDTNAGTNGEQMQRIVLICIRVGLCHWVEYGVWPVPKARFLPLLRVSCQLYLIDDGFESTTPSEDTSARDVGPTDFFCWRALEKSGRMWKLLSLAKNVMCKQHVRGRL